MSDLVKELRQYHADMVETDGGEAGCTALYRLAADEIERQKADKDGAYLERNQLVALLARLFPSGIARTEIPGWLPEWHGCVYIDLPKVGQVSWHYHDSHAHLFASLPPYVKPWDGHTTEEKYERLAALYQPSPTDGTSRPTTKG